MISLIHKNVRSAEANIGLVIKRKTGTRTARSQMGEGSWEGFEAEEFNFWRRSKPAAMAIGQLENCTLIDKAHLDTSQNCVCKY